MADYHDFPPSHPDDEIWHSDVAQTTARIKLPESKLAKSKLAKSKLAKSKLAESKLAESNSALCRRGSIGFERDRGSMQQLIADHAEQNHSSDNREL